MEFGFTLKPDHSLQRVVSLTRLAESAGFSHGWLFDSHVLWKEPYVLLALMAQNTTRIRLGTAVSVVPLYKPIRLAEEIAMLDVLSNGRVDWGAGRGYQGHEFRGYATDISESKPMLQEALELAKRAWSDERLTFHGRYTDVEDLEVLPKPVQEPHPPIYIAAISPASVVWAGENGYPFMADQFQVFDRLREARAEFDQAVGARGGNPRDHRTPVLRQTFVAETTEEARRIAAPALLWYYRALAAVGSPGGSKVGERGDGGMPASYEDYSNFFQVIDLAEQDPDAFVSMVLDQAAICGDPDFVAGRIGELASYGYGELIAWMNFGGLSHEDAMASMRLFAEEVMPRVALLEPGAAPAPASA